MTATALSRAGIVALLVLATYLGILAVRYRIRRRGQRVLLTQASGILEPSTAGDLSGGAAWVQILAFSSDDCAQCHRMQTPVLRRVVAERAGAVRVVDVDAPTSPELTARYQVLTLPTTVVLDGTGRARAINYGFANSQRLLQQVDEVLAADPVS
ncbi:MAG TPA: thioredoxin family protein [Ktedonobacterales bacterium]|nr:thioredoxin family protein [Ktedonobacterales bacterium]